MQSPLEILATEDDAILYRVERGPLLKMILMRAAIRRYKVLHFQEIANGYVPMDRQLRRVQRIRNEAKRSNGMVMDDNWPRESSWSWELKYIRATEWLAKYDHPRLTSVPRRR